MMQAQAIGPFLVMPRGAYLECLHPPLFGESGPESFTPTAPRRRPRDVRRCPYCGGVAFRMVRCDGCGAPDKDLHAIRQWQYALCS